jgi:biopolymer transport protein ExbD
MTPTMTPQKKRSSDDSNIVPLINIVFLLLIFFMVAGQMRAGLPTDIKLPHSQLEAKLPANALAIQIDRDGQTYLLGKSASVSAIEQHLKKLSSTQSLSIALQADRKLKAANLDEVLAVLRDLGNVSISLYTTTQGS